MFSFAFFKPLNYNNNLIFFFYPAINTVELFFRIMLNFTFGKLHLPFFIL